VSQGPQLGEDALFTVAQDISEGPGFLSLWRVNTRTGKSQEIDVPPWSRGFLIDHQAEPVAALAAHGDTARLHWRDGDGWRLVQEHERFFGDAFALLGLSPDGTVYVSARRGHDQSALYTYEPKTNTLSDKALLRLNQFDLEPGLIFGKGKLLGVHVQADASTTVWLDEDTKALQADVDERLPVTTNLLSLPSRGDSPWVLVWAYSDQQPVLALVYHRARKKLTLLGRSMPQIATALMSTMSYTPYVARDGRTIPAYLTLPLSAGTRRPVPLVVLVHGGPFARGSSWAWNAEVQFLASRGYAVLQPEFRGSTGFGESHFKAGWKQWGQAMQDDLADGARWAVAQGHADPARVAIAGGSYGGYAALMGLARQSDVFACAVNWLGPTDLDLIYGAHWSDQSGVYKRYGLPKVLGDRRADADMLRKHSPIHLAERITKPVLMAYGKLDLRVPIEHGERMRDALEPHNKQVEWVRYDDEGHGWYRQKTRRDFWTRVETFLARHLKP
jgi:dienelactone hydrolase